MNTFSRSSILISEHQKILVRNSCCTCRLPSHRLRKVWGCVSVCCSSKVITNL